MIDDDSGSDFEGGSKAKAKKRKGAPKQPTQPRERGVVYVLDGDVETTTTGRRKRKDAGTKWKGDHKAKAWTDDERRKFLEALSLHGRDWKKVRVCLSSVGYLYILSWGLRVS